MDGFRTVVHDPDWPYFVGALRLLIRTFVDSLPTNGTDLKNRAHIDLTVENVERAVNEVLGLGGSVIKEPATFPETDPLLEWAVMADPSGNEFCLIRELEQTL